MGPTAPPNRLGRPGSSPYLVDSIGVSSSYCLSRPIRPTYVSYFCFKSTCIELYVTPHYLIVDGNWYVYKIST